MATPVRKIAPGIALHDDELQWHAVRARGPGGQHVNKTSTAVELRFDISASRLPDAVKQRLLEQPDRRITAGGTVVIRAQQARSQKLNRRAALDRLAALVEIASRAPTARVATRPPPRAVRARLAGKQRRAATKRLRGRVRGTDDG